MKRPTRRPKSRIDGLTRAQLRRLAVLSFTLGELIDLLDRRYLLDAEVEAREGLRLRGFRFGPPVNGFCALRTAGEAAKAERRSKMEWDQIIAGAAARLCANLATSSEKSAHAGRAQSRKCAGPSRPRGKTP